jgi:CheY-like chemotaxis protein
MPGDMTGFDLARQLRATHPHLPIIFTSGDVADTADYDPSLQHSVKHLLKPYRPSELLLMVAGMLPPVTAAA